MDNHSISQQTATTEHNHRGINWAYQFQQYGVACAIAVPIFALLSIYLYNRRGFYDLYIMNKVFAGEAAVLLGIVLLIGPLSRFFSFPDHYIQYRKEIGIVAFFFALAHGTSSYYFLPNRFPVDIFYGALWWPFVFGLLGIIFLTGIFIIGNDFVMRKMDPRVWWPLQYWGVRIVFALTALHVFVMKWSGWILWYQKGGAKELVHPEWPGAGILVGWFIAFVILVRIAELGGQKFGKVVWYFSVIALPIVYIMTFWWGGQLIR
ncbi:MAG: hypothetical protein AAB362_00195 [Patescibacteria group bacterium]